MIRTARWQKTSTYMRRLSAAVFVILVATIASSEVNAAIGTAGDVVPIPPTAGGNVIGPFRVGNTGVGAMTLADGVLLTNTNAAIVGDTVAGLGVAVVNNSSWNLITSGADLTVANSGSGSLRLLNFGTMNVNDSLLVASQINSLGDVSITGFGTILRAGGSAVIAPRGQAVVTIQEGGQLLTGTGLVGNEITSDGRVTLRGQFSLWRTSSTITISNAGRAVLQVLDGARVEDTSATIAALAGSTGSVEVAGLGSLWQNSQGIIIGDAGNGTLFVNDGGYVTTSTAAVLTTIGRQTGSIGHVEVRDRDSLLSTSLLTVGGLGDGDLRILAGGRVKSANVILGDNTSARGVVTVDGAGSSWEIIGDLAVSDPGEAHLTIANDGLVRSSVQTRVAANGQITLDGGRLEIGSASGLLNVGIVDGNGTIEGIVNNNAGGQLRTRGAAPLIITNTLNNSGLVDIQGGELEVFGATNNNLDIDARDGAVLRFRGTGLDNNLGAQLAITSGVVDMFGAVDNNVGAEIVVGGTAVAVFHDPVTNNGTLFVQPDGKVLMLDNLSFGATSVFSLPLQADDIGQLQVAGSVQLGGELQVKLSGGSSPLPGDQFTFLHAGSIGGTTFATVSGGSDSGLKFFPVYSPTDVTIFTTAGNETTWAVDANASASVGSNWFGGVAPSGIGGIAAFTTIITDNRTVTLEQPLTVGRLKFDDDNNYTIAGPKTLTLQTSPAMTAAIDVQDTHGNGAHTIGAPIVIASDLDIIQNSAGLFTIAGSLDNSAGHSIRKSGVGSVVVAGLQQYGPGATLTIAEGNLSFNTNAGSNTARNLTVNANSTTNFGAGQHLAALNVGAGATATLTAGGPKNLVTDALTIAGDSTPTGKLDLTDNGAVVDYPAAGPSPAATIRDQIIAGRGGSGLGKPWNGLGITSSQAQADVATSPNSTSVGYAVNGETPLGAVATFRGQPVDATSVLIRYTRTADANLDGVVDNNDVTIVGANYAPGVSKPAWALGDFDYNGFVDNDDVTLLGAFYNPTVAPADSPGTALTTFVSATPVSSAITIPEPTTIVLLVVASAVIHSLGACGWVPCWLLRSSAKL